MPIMTPGMALSFPPAPHNATLASAPTQCYLRTLSSRPPQPFSSNIECPHFLLPMSVPTTNASPSKPSHTYILHTPPVLQSRTAVALSHPHVTYCPCAYINPNNSIVHMLFPFILASVDPEHSSLYYTCIIPRLLAPTTNHSTLLSPTATTLSLALFPRCYHRSFLLTYPSAVMSEYSEAFFPSARAFLISSHSR